MEKIRINGIEPKFGKPNDKGVCTPFWAVAFEDGRKATVWDAQIADYMMKDVGLGGECSVELKQKDQFTNVRAVDMTSAVTINEQNPNYGQEELARAQGELKQDMARVKGASVGGSMFTEVKQGERSLTGQAQKSVASERGNSIVCQCLLKIAGDKLSLETNTPEEYGREVCGRLKELVAAYKLGLSLLD